MARHAYGTIRHFQTLSFEHFQVCVSNSIHKIKSVRARLKKA